MRLSEAIRIGSMMRPQTKGHFFDETGSCALGAAYEGTFGKIQFDCRKLLFELNQKYPIMGFITKFTTVSPEYTENKNGFSFYFGEIYVPLGTAITNLNDKGSTREEIAQYVEEFENRYERHIQQKRLQASTENISEVSETKVPELVNA